MRRSPKPILLAALVAMGAAVVGCGSGDDVAVPGSGPDEPRTDVDPRSYYLNYPEHSMEDGGSATAGAPAPGALTEENADTEATTDPISPEPPVEPGFLDENTFEDPGENPFVATSEDAQSTFGFDVDTGSFQVGRTFLEEGYLPETDSVRTEEWVNAFGYDYSAPEGGDDLAVHVDGAPSPFEDGTHVVRVGAQTPTVTDEERPDAAITLVVDTSGSMDIRERLGLVQSTLALFAVHLRDSDTVAVVTFENEAETLLPPTPVAEVDSVLAAIDELEPSGGTNMEAGLRRGYDLAEETFREDAINTVVLASDGVANQGETAINALGDLAREKADQGIRLVTVGYGMGNYHDDRMEQLSNRGDGFYAYVDTYEEAERLFSTQLTTTLTIVAAEARAQVNFDPDIVDEYRLLGYENRDLADDSFRDDNEDTGDLGAGHAVTALYEVRLADNPAADPAVLGEVTVRHRPADVGGNLGDAVEQTVPISADSMAPSFEDAPANLRLAGTVAAFAELMAEHQLAVDRGVTLDQLASLAGGIEGIEDDGKLATPQDLVDLIDLAQDAEPPISD